MRHVARPQKEHCRSIFRKAVADVVMPRMRAFMALTLHLVHREEPLSITKGIGHEVDNEGRVVVTVRCRTLARCIACVRTKVLLLRLNAGSAAG